MLPNQTFHLPGGWRHTKDECNNELSEMLPAGLQPHGGCQTIAVDYIDGPLPYSVLPEHPQVGFQAQERWGCRE